MADVHGFVRAANLADLKKAGRMVVNLDGHTVLIIIEDGRVHAVDNRCPHMGFPLHRGTVKDGILTCHWHHARFDLETGGTFDLFADDARSFPAEVRGNDVWVDLSLKRDERAYQLKRLEDGLKYNIPLLIAKASIRVAGDEHDDVAPFRAGILFGTQYGRAWGQGLTMLTCFMNLVPLLDAEDRPRALYQGISAVARDTFNQPPRFSVAPLPDSHLDLQTIKRWFRQFVEVRDTEGAERCLASAVEAGASDAQIADMLFAAATDHRYLHVGHVTDFTNKALEALDHLGWGPERLPVLSSLARLFTAGTRMEESNAWRHPVDLVEILNSMFDELPSVELGTEDRSTEARRNELVSILLNDDPNQIAAAMLDALRSDVTPPGLARIVAYAAALRIARFHVTNEFSDWDTALHTFTFANAVSQGMRRAPSKELLRGVFDAAMSVYLDRFLNIPATALPEPNDDRPSEKLLPELAELLDQRHKVNESARLVASYLMSGRPEKMMALLGNLLLREDRDFHTIQTVEAAFRLFRELPAPSAGNVLVAAVRYLAAHSPTVRSQDQTYRIALRLNRGEKLYEDDETVEETEEASSA